NKRLKKDKAATRGLIPRHENPEVGRLVFFFQGPRSSPAFPNSSGARGHLSLHERLLPALELRISTGFGLLSSPTLCGTISGIAAVYQRHDLSRRASGRSRPVGSPCWPSS